MCPTFNSSKREGLLVKSKINNTKNTATMAVSITTPLHERGVLLSTLNIKKVLLLLFLLLNGVQRHIVEERITIIIAIS